MTDEMERLAIHESAHALVNAVFFCNPGAIDLTPGYGGRCRPFWPDEAHLNDSDEAIMLYNVHSCLAGYVGETLAFGQPDVWGCSADLVILRKSLDVLTRERTPLPRQAAEMVVSYLLKTYERPLRAAASMLYPESTTTNDKLLDRMISFDTSNTLADFHKDPLLRGPYWKTKWQTLKDAGAISLTRERLGLSPVRA